MVENFRNEFSHLALVAGSELLHDHLNLNSKAWLNKHVFSATALQILDEHSLWK